MRPFKYCLPAAISLLLLFLLVPVVDLIFGMQVSPWHDELWNIYPSLYFFGIDNSLWPGCRNGMCLNLFGKHIPMLSGPYHGVIKSFLYSPIALIGNHNLVRVLNIALYSLPLLHALFRLRRDGNRVIIAPLVYYFIFPNLVYEAFFDQGQIVIGNTLNYFALLLLCRLGVNYSTSHVFFIACLASLSVYEKLTTIPAFLTVYIILTYAIWLKRDLKSAIYAALPAFLAAPYLIYIATGHIGDLLGMVKSVPQSYYFNLDSIASTIYRYIFSTSFTLTSITNNEVINGSPIVNLLVVFTGIGVAAYLTLTTSHLSCKRPYYLIIFSSIFVLLIMPLFDGLSRPWHTYQLLPFFVAPFLVMETIDSFTFAKTKLKSILWILISIAIFNTSSAAISATNRARIHPMDGQLIDIASRIKSHSQKKDIVCLDYSVCYNLVFLLGRDYRLLSEWSFAPVDHICTNLKNIKGRDFILVTHDPQSKSYDHFLYDRSIYFFDHCSDQLNPIINKASGDAPFQHYHLFESPLRNK